MVVTERSGCEVSAAGALLGTESGSAAGKAASGAGCFPSAPLPPQVGRERRPEPCPPPRPALGGLRRGHRRAAGAERSPRPQTKPRPQLEGGCVVCQPQKLDPAQGDACYPMSSRDSPW